MTDAAPLTPHSRTARERRSVWTLVCLLFFTMNKKYKAQPEVISSIRYVNQNGDERIVGDRVTSLAAYQTKTQPDGYLQIDIRGMGRNENMLIEIELHELVAALSLATLNAERQD
jgi:hypothetical protein